MALQFQEMALVRNKLNRLPENIKKRSRSKFMRYEKKVPGHHVQIDVKFLFFKDEDDHRIKRVQYTAIDDWTRIRALKIYEQHNQSSSIDFINYVVEKFPFRIKTIRTEPITGMSSKPNFNGMLLI